MEREYSTTGEWCTHNGIICDNHKDSADWLPLKSGASCMNRFYGLCDRGSCYIPCTSEPKEKQITIKACTIDPDGGLINYTNGIGHTFHVENEFSDSVLIKIKDQLYAILMRDCDVKLMPKRKVARLMSGNLGEPRWKI
jgi:hypothetical protein